MASPLVGIAGVNSLLLYVLHLMSPSTNPHFSAAYGQSKKIISPYGVLSLPQTALAGGAAGAINSLLASPVELFKIRMQGTDGLLLRLKAQLNICEGQYGAATDKKLRHIFQETYAKYGVRHGVMRGFWITVIREVPAYAGFYTAYEFSKRSLHKRMFALQPENSNQRLPFWATLSAGATGGVAYWTACYPFGDYGSTVTWSFRLS